jgi:hypothetical protein
MSASLQQQEHPPLHLLPPGREGGMAEVICALAAIVARLDQERSCERQVESDEAEHPSRYFYLISLTWVEEDLMKAGIYLRTVALDPEEQDEAIAAQRAACRAIARMLGVEVGYELLDQGASGVTMERPGLQALREAVRQRAVGVVIAANLEVLAHSVLDLATLCEECAASGVMIHLAAGSDADGAPASPYDDVMEPFVEIFQQTIRRQTASGADRQD